MGVRHSCELCGVDETACTVPWWRFEVVPFRLSAASPLTIDEFTACGPCREQVVAGDWPDALTRYPGGTLERTLTEAYRNGVRGVGEQLAA